MSFHKKSVIVFILSILVLLGLYGLFKLNSKHQTQTAQQNQYGIKQEAPSGKLANGFPIALKLDASSSIDESFSIPYQQAGQYTATFISDKSVSDIYNLYSQYLKANDYKILNSQLKTTSAHLYGTKPSSDLNITITRSNNKTNILVSYLAK